MKLDKVLILLALAAFPIKMPFRLVFVISIVLNMALLLALLIIYLSSYLKTKSSFTLGLVFFIGVLLIQKIMIIFYPLFPQFFETLALAILLILSIK